MHSNSVVNISIFVFIGENTNIFVFMGVNTNIFIDRCECEYFWMYRCEYICIHILRKHFFVNTYSFY